MLYDISKKQFDEQEYLFHFTSFEAFKNIIYSGQIWLNNFEKLNDECEKTYINDFNKNKIFITCFTNSIEEYFWNNYNNGKGKKEAIAIKFVNKNNWYQKIVSLEGLKLEHVNKTDFKHKSYSKINDWGVFDISGLKVQYKDDPSNDVTINHEIINFLFNCVNINQNQLIEDNTSIACQGFVKTKKWEQENEFRIRVTVRPKGIEYDTRVNYKKIFSPPFDKLAIDIKDIICSLEVYVTTEFEDINSLLIFCSKYNIKINLV